MASGSYFSNRPRRSGPLQISTVARAYREFPEACGIDERFDAYVSLSTLRTNAPVSSRRCRTTAEPMKPAPPVTKIVELAKRMAVGPHSFGAKSRMHDRLTLDN